MDESKGGGSPPSELDPSLYPDTTKPAETALVPAGTGGGGRVPPPPPPDDDDDDDDEGMLRMSFMGHLEELRSRIIKALMGLVVSFLICVIFALPLWNVVREPARAALIALGVMPPDLIAIAPMEQFTVIYVKVPLTAACFLGAPWVLIQIWGFIAPGLYKREKRWAAPFVLVTAGLFILGGLFAYFIAFRFGLTFLLGIALGDGVRPFITISEYFDLFFNVTVGIALVFEMPVLIFFLTLLRILSPRFLIKHSRYAILGIVVLAAVVTPTPDVFNLMLFAVPMCALYFVGVFASYLLVMHREGRKFPWRKFWIWTIVVILLLAAAGSVAMRQLHYHFVTHWPFLMK